jgi:hypothetical protein
MQQNLPKARSCAPPFGDRIEPLPRELSPAHYLDHDKVYLYNPSKQGMRFTQTTPDTLTLLDQKDSFVVIHNKNKDHEGGRVNEVEKFEQLRASYDVIIDYVANQLSLEMATKPANMNNRMNISPEDIKNIINAPNRALTPDAPKVTKKRAPPKPR